MSSKRKTVGPGEPNGNEQETGKRSLLHYYTHTSRFVSMGRWQLRRCEWALRDWRYDLALTRQALADILIGYHVNGWRTKLRLLWLFLRDPLYYAYDVERERRELEYWLADGGP